MLWVNQAGQWRRSKVFTPPIQHCLNRLGRIAQPMLRWDEYPSDFYGSKRRLYLPFGVGEPNFPNELASSFFFHHPVSESEQRPVTHISKQPRPAFFYCVRFSSDISRHVCVAP